jgi:hypothetical protein
MSRFSRAGDNDLDATGFSRGGELMGGFGSAVGGNDPDLGRQGEFIQNILCLVHQLEIGFTAHDNGNQRRVVHLPSPRLR